MHLTPGETNLDALLRTMEPVLHPEVYVFCTVPPGHLLLQLTPIATFREAEGLTLIVLATEAAQAGLAAVYPCRWITLNVHSSLEAVGFLARITGLLAAHGISVNPLSGYYHDHLFVPAGRAEEVMRLLGELRG
ncbi:ACT domain-containing protein [Hymenobacter volaticus]|uniref:ACT domain-containing protein n=1 Tax=Hymenobacter volaticus TaxID=2932254 RepID=A0ABY4G6S8_9BACT|nr:ACT domain-containing protein [Hymenobacter volaticus]UOQ66591.1 ACT domain-containing protein [Hymenobacter volaticus]